jgi:hypothetical protein
MLRLTIRNQATQFTTLMKQLLQRLQVKADYIYLDITWLTPPPPNQPEILHHTTSTRLVKDLSTEQIQVAANHPNAPMPQFSAPSGPLDNDIKYLYFKSCTVFTSTIDLSADVRAIYKNKHPVKGNPNSPEPEFTLTWMDINYNIPKASERGKLPTIPPSAVLLHHSLHHHNGQHHPNNQMTFATVRFQTNLSPSTSAANQQLTNEFTEFSQPLFQNIHHEPHVHISGIDFPFEESVHIFTAN